MKMRIMRMSILKIMKNVIYHQVRMFHYISAYRKMTNSNTNTWFEIPIPNHEPSDPMM